MPEGLSLEDYALLNALHEAARTDPRAFAAQLFAYYHDADRAERTPRYLLYLHLGMCVGLLRREPFDREDPRLYDAARAATHAAGLAWTDPRTGLTYPPGERRKP